MDPQQLFDHTIDLIHTYRMILDQRGITYVIPTDEELRKLELWEVRGFLKELINLSRTPL